LTDTGKKRIKNKNWYNISDDIEILNAGEYACKRSSLSCDLLRRTDNFGLWCELGIVMTDHVIDTSAGECSASGGKYEGYITHSVQRGPVRLWPNRATISAKKVSTLPQKSSPFGILPT
jgi:hypothetical protein